MEWHIILGTELFKMNRFFHLSLGSFKTRPACVWEEIVHKLSISASRNTKVIVRISVALSDK